MESGGESIQGMETAELETLDSGIGEGGIIDEAQNPDPDTTSEVPKGETASETVARILREAKGQDDTEPQSDGNRIRAKKDETQKGQIRDSSQQQTLKVDLPNRFSAQEKELYSKLPKEMKSAVSRMVKEHEQKFTESQTEVKQLGEQYQRGLQELSGIVESVKPFVATWAEQGLSVPQALLGLASVHHKLRYGQPEEKVNEYVRIGQQLGVNFDALAEYVNTGKTAATGQRGAPMPDISQHPQFLDLQRKVEGVSSAYEQAAAEQEEAAVQDMVREIESVRDSVDRSGKYLYPKLHEDEFYARAKPLVVSLLETLPELSVAEALKRVYATIEGVQPGNFQSSISRFPNNNNQRALQAAVTVRGRSAPSQTSLAPGEFPPEALKGSATDTARFMLEQLRRGG